MPSRTIGFLDSYDILGKAIPGIVLLFGLILLLPSELFPNTEASIRFRNLAAIFVASVVAGVVFGEGVHTLARLSEKALAWVNKRGIAIYRIFYQVRAFLTQRIISGFPLAGRQHPTAGDDTPWWSLSSVAAVLGYQFGLTADTKIEKIRPTRVNQRFRRGVADVVTKFGHAFVSHRTLFKLFVKEHAIRTRGDGPEDVRFSHFLTAVSEYYDLSASEFLDADEIYPLLMSHLDASPVNRSRRFQGRYSFTRGMWVSTALLSMAYFAVYTAGFSETARAAIESVFMNSAPMWFAGAVGLTVFVGFLLALSHGIEQFCRWQGTEHVGVFVPWVVAFTLTTFLCLIGRHLLWIVTQSLWRTLYTVSSVVTSAGEVGGGFIMFVVGVEKPSDIYIAEALGDGLFGLSMMLGISCLTFVIATGSYKRYYIEYTVIDTWESLEGAAGDRMSVEINNETIEHLHDTIRD